MKTLQKMLDSLPKADAAQITAALNSLIEAAMEAGRKSARDEILKKLQGDAPAPERRRRGKVKDDGKTYEMPEGLPESGFLNSKQLIEFVPFNRSSLGTKSKNGTFPAPTKMDGLFVWDVKDVRKWFKDHAP
jgi:predicted DNA-binding transcriptional regulator AlpA